MEKMLNFLRISFMNYMRLKTDKGDLEAEEYWKEKVKNNAELSQTELPEKICRSAECKI